MEPKLEKDFKSKDRGLDREKEMEALQAVIQILKETANNFRRLGEEADLAIHQKDNILRLQKLGERAQLLINLPNLLSDKLERISPGIKEKILRNIEWIVESAQKAMEGDETTAFLLEVLLTNRGDDVNSKNDLERLIASLEEINC